MSNYPPGTGPGDPNAPWNAPDPPTCPGCDRHIGDREDHADGCEHADLDEEELVEFLDELHKPTEPEDHPKYEERLDAALEGNDEG